MFQSVSWSHGMQTLWHQTAITNLHYLNYIGQKMNLNKYVAGARPCDRHQLVQSYHELTADCNNYSIGMNVLSTISHIVLRQCHSVVSSLFVVFFRARGCIM